MKYVMKYSLYLISALSLIILAFTVVNWTTMPVLQRMVGLFFLGIVLHVWEESKFPGGFTEMVTSALNFTASDPHFGEGITSLYVLVIIFIPFFFPSLVFLAMAPMLLGIVEVLGHLVAIRMSKSKYFYSPGLLTSVFVLLPISLYSIIYAVQNNLMSPIMWLFSFLYMMAGLLLAQQVVVRTSGMKYTEFLKNARTALFSRNKLK